MTKVVFLLLFLSSTSNPQYYYKGMYFLSMGDCEIWKPKEVVKMKEEATKIGFEDLHIDARCLEMDAKEFKPSLGT